MSLPTGDKLVIDDCNTILGRELGRNAYGKPYFTWRWSEDLLWPAFPTGKFKVTETKVAIPILGAPAETHDFEEIGDNGCAPDEDDYSYSANCKHCGSPAEALQHAVYSIQSHSTPEYRFDERQTRKRDTWMICKWLTPWEFIMGPGRGATSLMHGDQQNFDKEPPQEAVLAAWERLFPGAPFITHGWRMPTDAYLPASAEDENWANRISDETTPNLSDTRRFVQAVKFQTSRPHDVVLADMLAQEDRKNTRDELLIGDECRDAFQAYLNPAIGQRGGPVSMPSRQKDIIRL